MNGSPYAASWTHFDLVLGLTSDLLPVVADHSVAPSPRSTVKALGKVPGTISAQGAVGFPRWTEHVTIGRDVTRWSGDKRLGLCLQTRHVRALDIDVDDEVLAAEIERLVWRYSNVDMPVRRRPNSGKRLMAFIVEGELPKRSFRCDGGLVEFLGNGQQFIVDSVHPSGVRYEWDGGLPDQFPVLSIEQFEDLWSALVADKAVEVLGVGGDARRRGPDLDVPDARLNWLDENWTNYGYGRGDELMIECPWKGGHSGDSGPTETVYFPAGTNGYEQGHYRCLHASCSARTDADFDAATGYAAADFDEVPEAAETDPEEETPRMVAVPADDFVLRPAPRWIIKNVLPEAQLGMVFGASGAGKSFFVLDLVASIARGTEWRGNRVRQMGVIYVCAEGAGGFRNRVAAYRQQYDIAFGDQLHVIADQPDFLGSGDAKLIAGEAVRVGAGLVVIDTLAQVTPGGDENSAVDMGKAIRKCRQISETTGAMVLLVHHAGKDTSRGARGWSGIRAAADAEIEVSVHKSGVRVARLTKQKDGRDGTAFGFTLETVPIGQDDDGDLIESCVIAEAEVPTDDGAAAPRGEPKGKVQKIVWRVFQGLVETDGGADMSEVVEGAADEMEGERWRNQASAKRTVENMMKEADDGFAWFDEDGGRLFARAEI